MPTTSYSVGRVAPADKFYVCMWFPLEMKVEIIWLQYEYSCHMSGLNGRCEFRRMDGGWKSIESAPFSSSSILGTTRPVAAWFIWLIDSSSCKNKSPFAKNIITISSSSKNSGFRILFGALGPDISERTKEEKGRGVEGYPLYYVDSPLIHLLLLLHLFPAKPLRSTKYWYFLSSSCLLCISQIKINTFS